jgi:hypothetical protein
MHLLATKPKRGSYDNLSNCALGVVSVGGWRLGILPLASVAVYKSPTSLPGFFDCHFGIGLSASFTVTGRSSRCKFYSMQSLPICQVGITASGTWKFPDLLSMTNEKVDESVPR